jgi:hypothetical protein
LEKKRENGTPSKKEETTYSRKENQHRFIGMFQHHSRTANNIIQVSNQDRMQAAG